MDVSERQQRTINLLLSSREFVTASEVAAQLGVSVRTVYRDIATINSVATVIVNAPGKGIKIDFAAFTAETERLMRGRVGRGLSIAGRRRSILLLLLIAAPHPRSVIEFSELFHVGTSSIQNDLAGVASLAEEKHLTVTADAKGTRVVGSEAAIRDAIADLVVPLFAPERTANLEAANELAFLRSQGMFCETDLRRIAEAIADVEQKHSLRVENPYYINLITHLLIVAERLRLARVPGEPPDTLPDDRGPGPSMPNADLAAAASDMVHRLAESLDLAIPVRETNRIYAFLQGSDDQPDASGITAGDGTPTDDGLTFTVELVDRVSSRLGVNLRDDKLLVDRLVLHVRPMLFRSAHGVQIRNPVLDDVKDQYADLFAVVLATLDALETDHGFTKSSASEAAYLVLYFQQALDRLRRRLRIVIVCSTGRGTALFLRSRIERRFPDWNIVKLLGVRDLDKTIARVRSAGDVDLVVSTVPLEGLPVPVALVNSLLTEVDIDILLASAQKAGWAAS